MSDKHRDSAEFALRHIPGADVGVVTLTLASQATAYALLVVDSRLGEIAAEMRKANTIAAFEARVIKDDAEYIQARNTVRAVLGLATTPEGQAE